MPSSVNRCATANSSSAIFSHFCARSPLFFIQDFAFAQRGRFNSETGTSPLCNFFWCADDDFLVYAETEVGEGLVDGTRSLPRRLAGCLNDDKQIDVAVWAMRAAGATAKENDFLGINCPNDSLNDLLRKLWCKFGQVSRNRLREHARGLVRIAQAVEQLIALIANIFADLDEIPAIPLVLFADAIGSRHPAILCRPDFFCFVALLAGYFQNKIDRFPGIGADANDKIWVIDFLLPFFVGVRNAKIEKGILDPRDDAAFIRQIIQHFRHLAFPAAVDDNNVHVAVFCRMHFLTLL